MKLHSVFFFFLRRQDKPFFGYIPIFNFLTFRQINILSKIQQRLVFILFDAVLFWMFFDFDVLLHLCKCSFHAVSYTKKINKRFNKLKINVWKTTKIYFCLSSKTKILYKVSLVVVWFSLKRHCLNFHEFDFDIRSDECLIFYKL